MPTSTSEKHVFWFDDHKTPDVADVLAHEADFVVHRLAFNAPAADNWAAMAPCHALLHHLGTGRGARPV